MRNFFCLVFLACLMLLAATQSHAAQANVMSLQCPTGSPEAEELLQQPGNILPLIFALSPPGRIRSPAGQDWKCTYLKR
jgi:hypothetical protein